MCCKCLKRKIVCTFVFLRVEYALEAAAYILMSTCGYVKLLKFKWMLCKLTPLKIDIGKVFLVF